MRAGLGKVDITVYEDGMCMFGWGQPGNVSTSVAAPLFARALVVESSDGTRAAYVCADLGFVSQQLRRRVLELLGERAVGLGEHEVMLTATHTHSGPNGYSAYLFYGVTGPGFSARVLDGLAHGIVSALEQAIAALAPARLHVSEVTIPLSEPIMFNRSLGAYNLNADVEPLGPGRSDESLDRRMVVLRVDDLNGNARGLVAWLPLHGTCIHHENTRIHPDHKGVAAAWCEDEARRTLGRSIVAMFPQEASGDVTPNYRWDERRRLLVGRYDDDFENATYVGEIEARHAWKAFLDARGAALDDRVARAIRYVDFEGLPVDPDFANGLEGQSTSTACLGLGFAYGTLEGPGPAFAIRDWNRFFTGAVGLARRARRRSDWRTQHGRKLRFFDLGRGAAGKIMTFLPTLPPGFGRLPDRRVHYYRDVLESRRLGDRPWVPQILPVQIFRIGSLAIVGIAAEPTTVSGRRLRAAAMSVLAKGGVENVVINGYANAYASYVTTFEEYQLQHYEGASTVFGQWTLGAWCTELRRLARDLVTAGSVDGLGEAPLSYDAETLLPAPSPGHLARAANSA